MTFHNPAYGSGTFVRCDTCRHPEALMEARADSEFVWPTLEGDRAEAEAIESLGFVRRGWRLLCGGCARVESARRRLVDGSCVEGVDRGGFRA